MDGVNLSRRRIALHVYIFFGLYSAQALLHRIEIFKLENDLHVLDFAYSVRNVFSFSLVGWWYTDGIDKKREFHTSWQHFKETLEEKPLNQVETRLSPSHYHHHWKKGKINRVQHKRNIPSTHLYTPRSVFIFDNILYVKMGKYPLTSVSKMYLILSV